MTVDIGSPFALKRGKPRSSDWGGKALLVCALALLMAIPGLFVWALIAERASRAERVTAEVSNLQGGAQQVLGPLIVVPYVQTTAPAAQPLTPGQPAAAPEVTRGWYVISPERGEAKVRVRTEERKRGIFPVSVYDAEVDIDATFSPAPATPRLPSGATVDWSRAQLVMGFSDLRGAKSDVVASVATPSGQRRVTFVPSSDSPLGGAVPAEYVTAGQPNRSDFGLVSAAASELLAGGRVTATLRFTGAERLSVLPFAKSTRVAVAGANGTPKFDGGFSPATPRFANGGFTATWNVPFVARGLTDQGPSSALSLSALQGKDLGVTFVRTNNPYQNVIRALKYAVMFVGLVFLTFFVFEALSGHRLHPAQYVLIGLAQMVFYLLLLSLSEYIGFDPAFIIAAVATVSLIGLYAGAAFQSRARAMQALGVFSVIYGLIYLLMRLEDFALLAGSFASFVGLAVVMWLTRNIEWYGGRAEPTPSPS